MEYSIKPKRLGERGIIHYPQKRIIGLYEKEMENKKLVVKGTEMEVVDGKVVISSEELAAAIQTQQIDLGAEEEANIDINIRGVHC